MVDVIKRGLNPRIRKHAHSTMSWVVELTCAETLTPLIVREIDYSFEKLLGSSTGK